VKHGRILNKIVEEEERRGEERRGEERRGEERRAILGTNAECPGTDIRVLVAM
jgi:hypothetical protein